MASRDPPAAREGEGESGGPSTRRNFDKRTLRKMYSGVFTKAIAKHAEQLAQEEASVKQQQTLTGAGTLVLVRKRPLFKNEIAENEFDIVTPRSTGTVLHDCRLRSDLRHPYIAHRTFPVKCLSAGLSNQEVCEYFGLKKLIHRAINGEHVTCCMFGQTGSGKTYTMSGILQHAADILFKAQIHEMQRSTVLHARLACFEVAGNAGFDLLANGAKLVIREDAKSNVQISAKLVPVRSSGEFLQQVNGAIANRATSSTLKNMESSRSHAFYKLILRKANPENRRSRTEEELNINPSASPNTPLPNSKPRIPRTSASSARASPNASAVSSPSASRSSPRPSSAAPAGGSITFVDLAGSERVWDSMYHNAEQRKQTAEINASLSCLKECFRIRSLQMQRGAKVSGNSPSHSGLRVPYRDSRLTLLLRDSLLCTTSKEPCVIVIATLSPSSSDTEHTLSTLRNAVTMTGMDVNHSNKGETVMEEDLQVVNSAFLAQEIPQFKEVKHPTQWTVDEVKEWMSSVADGKYVSAAKQLPKTTDGKSLLRFPQMRFKHMCDNNQKKGEELYRLLRAEVNKANESKAASQKAIRNQQFNNLFK